MSDLFDIVKGSGVNVEAESAELNMPVADDDILDTPAPLIPEEPVETVVPKKTEEKPELTFDLGSFNKKFSKEFASEDDILGTIEKATKYSELESKLAEITEKYAEMEEIAKKGTDPMKWFANSDEYIRQQFLLKKGSEFTPDAMNVLTKLTPSSIDKMNAWDALKTSMLIDGEFEGGEEAAKELLMDKYNVDGDNWDEFDTKTRNLIKLDAKQAKASLKSVFDGIELPREVNFEQSKQQLKDVWQSPLTEIVKGVDKIKIADGIDFAVSDDMKSGILEEAMNEIISNRVSPSKDSGAELASTIREKILIRNLDKVLAHHRSVVESEVKAQYRAKIENNEPVNNGSKDAQSEGNKAALDWLKNL